MCRCGLAPYAFVVALLAAGPGSVGALDLRLERLNRVYQDMAGELPPLRLDPVVIRLSSPRQSVLLKENRVFLEALDGGRFRARVELDLLGKGDLIAEVDLGGSTQRFTDELLMPRQTLVVEGIVRILRDEDGFRVVTEELPPDVAVVIRSRLIGQVIDLCAGAALLTLGSLDCGPIAEALENPRIPLPAAGFELHLADSELDPDDRAAFEALLAGR